MSLHGTKALERWCRDVTAGYEGVSVLNMSTSWRSGLGFCALIHHFRPDLIDFAALDPDDALGNNALAFETAERHLGVPALLDPRDMAECELIDRLSVLTYLSQFYQVFRGSTEKGKCGGRTPQRTGSSLSSSENSSPAKARPAALAVGRRSSKEPCTACGKPVFILERLNVDGKLLHRTCFKCGRCGAQLNVVSYYETEAGEYCCDVCPDEEVSMAATVKANQEMVDKHLEPSGKTSPPLSSDSDEEPPKDGVEEEVKTDDEKSNAVTSVHGSKSDINANDVKVCLPEERESSNEPKVQQADQKETSAMNAEAVDDQDKQMCTNEDVTSAGSAEGEIPSKKGDADNPFEDGDDENGDDSAVFQDKDKLPVKEKVEDEEEEEEEVEVKSTQVFIQADQVDVDDEEAVKAPSTPLDEAVEVAEEEDKLQPPKDKGTSDSESPSAFESADDGEHRGSEDKEGSEVLKEEDLKNVSYPTEKNPFGDDEEDEVEDAVEVNKEEVATVVLPPHEKKLQNELKNEEKKESTNPFGSDFEESEEEEEVVKTPSTNVTSLSGVPLTGPPKPPRANASPAPAAPVASKSLNPFGSDFEDDDEEDRQVGPRPPSPSPSSCSSARSRKKRPAPQPPGASPVPSPRTSQRHSNSLLAQPTPAPRNNLSPRPSPRPSRLSPTPTRRAPPPPRPPPPTADVAKDRKDRDNLNRRSQLIEAAASTSGSRDLVLTPLSPDKAAVEGGQWRRKKGPAPPRPIPQKRQVKLPRQAVNTELADIEVKQRELERQGVKLETTIRELCDKRDRELVEAGPSAEEQRDSLGPEVEDLIIQMFDLVNEKNDLFRRQTELMYMKKDHRLEEEYADLEHQVRVLMAKSDSQRTDDDKVKEEELINRMMTVVQERNEIVDCMEMDRLRELEEDESFETHMGEYAAVKPSPGVDEASGKKKKKKKKKEKKEKSSSSGKKSSFDADKDIDTAEHPNESPRHQAAAASSPRKEGGADKDKDRAKKFKKKLLATLATAKKGGNKAQ